MITDGQEIQREARDMFTDPDGMNAAMRIGAMVRDLHSLGYQDAEIAVQLLETVAILAFRGDVSNIKLRQVLNANLSNWRVSSDARGVQ